MIFAAIDGPLSLDKPTIFNTDRRVKIRAAKRPIDGAERLQGVGPRSGQGA